MANAPFPNRRGLIAAIFVLAVGNTVHGADITNEKGIVIDGVPGKPKWFFPSLNGFNIAMTKATYDADKNTLTMDMELTASINLIYMTSLSDRNSWGFNFYDEDGEVIRKAVPDRCALSGNVKGEKFSVILELPGKKTMEKTRKVILK